MGENDAIITLVWDRMDERLVGGEPYYYVGYVGDYYFYSLYQLNLTEALRNRLPVCEGTPPTCNGRSSPYWILPVAIILTLALALAYCRKTKRGEKEKDKGP